MGCLSRDVRAPDGRGLIAISGFRDSWVSGLILRDLGDLELSAAALLQGMDS